MGAERATARSLADASCSCRAIHTPPPDDDGTGDGEDGDHRPTTEIEPDVAAAIERDDWSLVESNARRAVIE